MNYLPQSNNYTVYIGPCLPSGQNYMTTGGALALVTPNSYGPSVTGYYTGYLTGTITGGNITGLLTGRTSGRVTGYLSGQTSGTMSGYLVDLAGIAHYKTYQTGYYTGFYTGYVTGYPTGFVTGYLITYQSGQSLNYQTGLASSYPVGFSANGVTGYLTGNYTGYITGYRTGYYTGYVTGYMRKLITGFIRDNIVTGTRVKNLNDWAAHSNNLSTSSGTFDIYNDVFTSITSISAPVQQFVRSNLYSGINTYPNYLYGEVYIPSSNNPAIKIGVMGLVSGGSNTKVSVINTLDSWIPVNYSNTGFALTGLSVVLLATSSSEVASTWPPNVTGFDGDYFCIRNFNVTYDVYGLASGAITGYITGRVSGIVSGAISGNISGRTYGLTSGYATGLVSGNAYFISGWTGISSVNLIQDFHRIQSVSFDWAANRNKFDDFGGYNLQDNVNIFYPQGNLSIDYLQFALDNERKAGLNVNANCPTGGLLYNGFNYNILDNITGERMAGFSTGFLFPLQYNKYKNIYINVTKDGNDSYTTLNTSAANDSSNSYTLGFGNCFLQSYKIRGDTRSMPVASLQYGFYNFTNQNGISGFTPCLHHKSGTYYSGSSYVLPAPYRGNLRAGFAPSDITVAITAPDNLEMNITGMKINAFSFDLVLNNKINESLGYSLPKDYNINFPLVMGLNVNATVTTEQTFKLDTYLRNNLPLNVSVYYQGCSNNTRTRVLQYDLLGCYLETTQENFSIGNIRGITMAFTQEISQNKANHGFYVSGNMWTNANDSSTGVSPARPIDFIYKSGTKILYYGY